MKQRIITAVIALLLLVVVLFYVPPIVAQVVIGAMILAGAWEWSAFLGAASRGHRIAYVGLIAALIATVSLLAQIDTPTVLRVSMLWWAAALIWMFFYPTGIPVAIRWLELLLLLPVSPEDSRQISGFPVGWIRCYKDSR